MQGKPKYITLHTSIRPLKTVTSEITAVHARVRVNTYAACATISHLLPLPEPRDYTHKIKRYHNGTFTGSRTPQKPRGLLEQSTITKLPKPELPFKAPPHAHTQTLSLIHI